MLLTTVTSANPLANSHDAAVSTDVAATFDQAVAAATAETFIVHGTQSRGQLSESTSSVSASGNVATHDPTNDFFPGETVHVTVTSGVTTAGGAATPYVWQFRTENTSGSGQFVDSGQVLGANESNEVRFGDLDGDGDLDTVHGGRLVWLNDGTGVFTDTGQSLSGGEVELADLDGDGDLDVVGFTAVWLNDGTGTFSNTGQNLMGGLSIDAGDLDGDGDMDIMQGVAYTGNRVWFNNGSGVFTNSGQSLGVAATEGLEFGDLDGDGDLDAFAANNGPDNRVWMNDGNGVFTDSNQALGGFAPSLGVDLGDLDGDGDLDALVSNNNQQQAQRVWLNDGGGVFTNSGQVINQNSSNWTSELGDMDGDGDLDVFVGGGASPSVVWTNDGAGNFSDTGQRLNFPGQRRARGIDLGDVDGDGDLDAWESNTFSGGGRLWINQNLTPSVSISIDSPTIVEADGLAAISATLSATHTEPVTVDLEISGTATVSDDYTISGTQILIPAGASEGSVAVTAVQDTVDEPDETVVVAVSSITNGQAAGAQQVMTTILDDDEAALEPDVTLAVDNASIAEDGGVATFTANLSEITTVPVTVQFEISGSAGSEDYSASATEVVIDAGETSGSITVTATQDDGDEPDETVIVSISGAINGNVVGVQQATTEIADDDEPVVPDVTLAVDNTSIPEDGGVATFTATLSETTTVDVTVNLAITGTATAGGDYTASGTEIVIAAGSTSGSVTVTAVQDEFDEPDESVVVSISGVTNGNEDGEQSATTNIADDDEPTSFAVTELTPTSTGFQAAFTNAIDAADLNLYDTQAAGMGEADATLTGATSGPIQGSLLVTGPRSVQFIATGGPLAADTYTVELRSAADGFEDDGGLLLDGNGDGTGGDNFISSFVIDEPAANSITIGIPDVVRGPGQDVNLPADTELGIPLTISNGDNVRAIDLRISYDPSLLTITGATAGEDAPGATPVLNTTTPGLAILVFFSSNSLPAGEGTFVNLSATVPSENASETYRAQQVLDVHNAVISDGNDNEFPVVVDDALHVNTFFADVSGNGRINAADAAGVARIAALIDSGFGTLLSTDPGVVGDISGNGRLNAADASLVAQFAALIPVPQIPAVPGDVTIAGVPTLPGPDEPPSLRAEDSATTAESESSTFQVVEYFESEGSEDEVGAVDAVLQDEDSLGALLGGLLDELDV